MEPIEVTVRWDDQGKVYPSRFLWAGSLYQVESTGRQWRDETGLHVLVMIPGGQVFELVLLSRDLRWVLGSSPRRTAVV